MSRDAPIHYIICTSKSFIPGSGAAFVPTLLMSHAQSCLQGAACTGPHHVTLLDYDRMRMRHASAHP